jgi:ligand-binding sensor domain-containing protein/signal transduction histidine kinase
VWVLVVVAQTQIARAQSAAKLPTPTTQTLSLSAKKNTVQTFAAAPLPALSFERLSLEQGLPQSTINAVLQDKQGFIWVATQDGLCRYDGYSFLVYRHDPENLSSLSDNFIQTLHEDTNGTLWVGTRTGGLNAYNPARGVFIVYRHQPSISTTLPSDNILTLCDAGDGRLWVGTNNGLALFNPSQRGLCTVFRADPSNPSSLLNNTILSLHTDQFKTLWIGTSTGLCKYTSATNTFTSCTQLNHEPTSASQKIGAGITAHQISTIISDRSGAVWVGSTKGLAKLNPSSGRLQTVFHAGNSALPSNDIRTILEDQNGRLWVGTNGNGLGVIDPATGRGLKAVVEFGNERSLANNFVCALYQDRQSIVWVGTVGGGLNKFDRARTIFTRYGVEPLNKQKGLSDNSVYAFYEESDGSVWVGTDGGLHKFNRLTGTFAVYKHNERNTSSLPHNTINTLFEDRTGTFWVGTFGGGLAIFDRKRGTSKNFHHNPQQLHSVSSDHITCMMEDSQGRLWIGTYFGGVCSFDRRTNTFTQYPTTPRMVICLHEDRTGKLWIGTQGDGIAVFDPTTGKCIQHYKHAPGNARTLSSNAVYCFYEEVNGTMWIATSSGLNRLDPTHTTFTTIHEKDGLPNEVLYCVVPDGRGYFWLSSNKGVARFAPTTGRVDVYTVSDGLQSNEFNQGGYHRGRSGRIYFGGIHGFNEFFPDSIRRNIFMPPVVLTNFKKFNQSFTFDTNISRASQIVLDYTDNVFSFEFAALNFSLTEKNKYAFQLEGFDKTWVEAGGRREVTYTNLEPRTYTFRVKASNNDGVWNEAGAAIRVVIRPPWWRTWWFRTGAILVIAAALLVWYRLRVYQVQTRNHLLAQQVEERTQELRDRSEEIERQNRQLVELNKDKNEIMGIVAHDLKNPLSNIMMLAKLLDQEAGYLSKEEIIEFANDIQTGATRMFALITNLLNVNAIEQGGIKLHPVDFDLYGLVQMLVHDYTPSANAKSITLHFENRANQDDIVTAFADRNAVTQAIDNLLSNAIKYSPYNKNVFVRLLTSDTEDRICIAIQDEGPGLSEQDKQHLFGKFARLSAQPTGGEHSTGLGLSIVKRLVEAMNGRIWCESELGKGATFIIELPSNL